MQQWNTNQQHQAEHPDMEQLLADYYGPELRESALPVSSWQHLQRKLGPQKARKEKRRFIKRFQGPMRVEAHGRVPAYIQEAFVRIAFEANIPYRASMLRCTLKQGIQQPAVSISHVNKHHIKLLLPISAAVTMHPAELDVLLATGLARYLLTRRGSYPLQRVALLLLFLLGLVGLIASIPLQGLSLGLPVGFVVGGIALFLLARQHYKMTLVADAQLVSWLGRSRVCEGLHSLASHARVASRKRWTEPSLAERIARTCGERASTKDERLTLVR